MAKIYDNYGNHVDDPNPRYPTPPPTDNQNTRYSISEKNIRQWFHDQNAVIVTPSFHFTQTDKFVEWMQKTLEQMSMLSNEEE